MHHDLKTIPRPVMAILPDQRKSAAQNFFDAANRYLLTAALLVALGLFGYVLYQLYWPVDPLHPTNSPYPVLNEELHVGERLTIDSAFCSRGKFPTVVTRVLQGDTYITLPPLTVDLPVGCHRYRSSSTVIPVGTPPGRYKLVYSTAIQINAFRTVTIAAETREFSVVAN